NGAVAFQNLTDTKGADEIISYSWDFNGEGSSAEANPSFTFTSGGSKTVSLTASIPGCSNTYDTTFVVEQGPVVDFNFPPQICQGEPILFENQTQGEGVTGYQWSFGDGGSYSSTSLDNPTYTYDSAGTYIAMLQVSNAAGCATTLSQTLTVYATPVAAFMADVACAGAPTQFTDESTTGINSNVIAWAWEFGDGKGTASSRNPQYVYEEPGVYQVNLMVTTSAGCTDTFVQEVVVESPVTADFTAQPFCPSEATPYTVQFNDASTVIGEEVISEWLWTINGENFVIADPSYTFAEPGNYLVSLTVFSESFCNASITRTVSIEPQPQPSFSVQPNCAGQPVSFSNQTLAEGVEIVAYQWTFGEASNPLGTSFEENPTFVFEQAGTYPVSLRVETAAGCFYNYTEEVNIPAAPRAAFSASPVNGGAPLAVNFSNSSSGGDTYLWDFGGLGSSSEANPSFTFDTPGRYTVSLSVSNALGCEDRFSTTIQVVEPVIDIALTNLSLLSEQGESPIRLLLSLHNKGTVPLTNFDITLTLDAVLTISEPFEGTLQPGERISYPLDFAVSGQLNSATQLRYACITLGGLSEEVSLSDNRACLNLQNEFSIIAPFPNPASGRLVFSAILPQAEPLQYSLYNSEGQLMQSLSFEGTRAGLNTFEVDVSDMVEGYYLLQLGYEGRVETFRVLVQR
ncbi:MAG: PKD domain-containing protein, partial [Cyclobacteriaceae bacterium]